MQRQGGAELRDNAVRLMQKDGLGAHDLDFNHP
jgi:hypothetical protein